MTATSGGTLCPPIGMHRSTPTHAGQLTISLGRVGQRVAPRRPATEDDPPASLTPISTQFRQGELRGPAVESERSRSRSTTGVGTTGAAPSCPQHPRLPLRCQMAGSSEWHRQPSCPILRGTCPRSRCSTYVRTNGVHGIASTLLLLDAAGSPTEDTHRLDSASSRDRREPTTSRAKAGSSTSHARGSQRVLPLVYYPDATISACNGSGHNCRSGTRARA